MKTAKSPCGVFWEQSTDSEPAHLPETSCNSEQLPANNLTAFYILTDKLLQDIAVKITAVWPMAFFSTEISHAFLGEWESSELMKKPFVLLHN